MTKKHKSDTTIATTTVVSDTTYAPTEATEVTTTVAESGYTFAETDVTSTVFQSKKPKPPSQPLGEQFKLGFLSANGNYDLADDYDAVRASAVKAKDKTRIAQADAGWKLKEASDRENITTHWPPKIACCGIFWTLGHYPMWGDKVSKLTHHEHHHDSHNRKSHAHFPVSEDGTELNEGEEGEIVEETEVMGADGKITKVKRHKKIYSEKLEWGQKERPTQPWAIENQDREEREKKKVFHEKLDWKVKDRVPLFTPAPKHDGKKKKGKGKGGVGSEESIATTIAGDGEQGDEPDEYDENGKLIPRKKIFHEKLKWEAKDRVPLFTPTRTAHKPKHRESELHKKRRQSKVGESELSVVHKSKKEPEGEHHKKTKKERKKTHGGGSGPSIQESAVTIQSEAPEVHGEDKHKKHKKSKPHGEIDASVNELHKKHKKSKPHGEIDASLSEFHKDANARKSRKSIKHKLDDGGEPKEIRGRSHDPIDLDKESMLGADESLATLAGKGKSGKHKGKKSLKPKAGEEPIPKARNLSSHRLRVSNLPVGVTVAELQPIFPGGTITLEHIGPAGKPKTVADVKFEEETDTFTAFKNAKQAELHGKPLIVAPLVRE